ncbi:PDR/VanB family oxidoreductase [Pusillimonas sp. NJUB218]|uniref:PDR/VanB family oxidoreductase n=1 Tax=Pusillimonas sp. NJUB218 TaxID=2023230 RepID=UPI000F4B5E12|nr:PDR/VanB family oxidoreductase [Pusillimonas sp. NJUB218]ROT45667.1 hypothetical protein CHR62_05245 [Pusillimonas sp. NJUB218]
MNGLTWFDTQVVQVRDLTPTVREFTLQFPQAVTAAAGAHINVQVIVGNLPETRSYSIVDSHTNGQVIIAVKAVDVSRGGSQYMWSLKSGTRLRASEPVSLFEPSWTAPEVLLLAGGIGVTPLVSHARALVQRQRPVHMTYLVRNTQEQAYADTLRTLLGDALDIHVADTHPAPDLNALIGALPPDGQLAMCGPIGLMEAVRSIWAQQGRPSANLRYETFGASGHHPTQTFTVHVPRLGIDVSVGTGQTMLDALNAAGVTTLSNCRRGECGLCSVDIIAADGAIDHRDVFYSPAQQAEQHKMCTCVSRIAGGSVTIEPAWRGDPDWGRPEVLQRKTS